MRIYNITEYLANVHFKFNILLFSFYYLFFMDVFLANSFSHFQNEKTTTLLQLISPDFVFEMEVLASVTFFLFTSLRVSFSFH